MSDNDKQKPSGQKNSNDYAENKENKSDDENNEQKEKSSEADADDEDTQINSFDDGENKSKPRTQSAEASGLTPTNANAHSPHSALYVLHTEKGNVSVNRRCHLPRSEGVNVEARRKLIVASILCLLFVFCEIIGGVISNSLAVAADAAHTLTDFAGFMISLFAIWLAGRKATDRLSFGWYRAEVIGALLSVMTIWFVTAILVWLAIERCISREFTINAVVMMITAAFGIVTNVILGIYLSYGASQVEMNCESNANLLANGHSHNHNKHAHGHHHQHGTSILQRLKEKLAQIFVVKPKTDSSTANGSLPQDHYRKTENINVKAAYLHVLGDGLQSVSVLFAAIIIYLEPRWILADPICTFLFSAIILYTTFNILKDIIVVLMEGTPTYVDYNAVQAIFEAIPGIKSIHHLRIWALSIDKIALAVHLVIERGRDPHEVLLKAEETIHTHYNLFETTIQIEEEGYERPTLVN